MDKDDYEFYADSYYERLELEESILEEDANKDPMYRLLQAIEAAKEFGCEMDKSFVWEGIDLLREESVDEIYGDGDFSQWDY